MRLRARKAMLGRGGIEDRSRHIYMYIVPLFGAAIGQSYDTMHIHTYR